MKLLLVNQPSCKSGYTHIYFFPQGEARENTWVGTFHCDPGYTLASRYDVCNSLVKQRCIGKNKMSNWLDTFPLFWQLGMCGSKTKSCQYQDFFRQGYITCVKYFCFVFCPPFLAMWKLSDQPPVSRNIQVSEQLVRMKHKIMHCFWWAEFLYLVVHYPLFRSEIIVWSVGMAPGVDSSLYALVSFVNIVIISLFFVVLYKI